MARLCKYRIYGFVYYETGNIEEVYNNLEKDRKIYNIIENLKNYEGIVSIPCGDVDWYYVGAFVELIREDSSLKERIDTAVRKLEQIEPAIFPSKDEQYPADGKLSDEILNNHVGTLNAKWDGIGTNRVFRLDFEKRDKRSYLKYKGKAIMLEENRDAALTKEEAMKKIYE